jgi:transcriptional regulator with GAF, ATPase, and Fis domain
MGKAKYAVVFVLILLCAIYQLLLSFDLAPYVFGGQDLFVIVLLLVSVMLLFVAVSVEKTRQRPTASVEEVPVPAEAERGVLDMGDLDGIEGKSLLRHVITLQHYLKESRGTKDLIGRMLVAAARVTRSGRGSVLLFDRRGGELYIHRTLGWSPAEIKLASATRVKPGEGIAGRVYLEGKPIVMNQPDDSVEFEPKEKYKSDSFACFPLHSGWDAAGVLNLTEKENETYSQNEIDLVSFIVQEASLLMTKQQGKRDKTQ